VLSGRRVMLDSELTGRLTPDDVRRRRIERPSFWWRHAKAHDRRNGIYAPALYGWRGGWSRSYAILGSNFSLSRDSFARVNGYDEAILGRGMEDINLGTRLLDPLHLAGSDPISLPPRCRADAPRRRDDPALALHRRDVDASRPGQNRAVAPRRSE